MITAYDYQRLLDAAVVARSSLDAGMSPVRWDGRFVGYCEPTKVADLLARYEVERKAEIIDGIPVVVGEEVDYLVPDNRQVG